MARHYLQLAGSLLDQGRIIDARAALAQAALSAPDKAPIYRALQLGYQAAGMPEEAVGAELAAIALEQQSALMLYNLATSYLMTQRPALAEKWYRATLRREPEMVAAHQNLASILEVQGNKTEAQYHRDQAYSRQSLFIDTAATPKRSVLILCTAATGNVPFDFLLPLATTTRIKWVMEYASVEQIADLPPYDLVFNAIGDQDVTQQSQAMVERFLRQCPKPVLNAPATIVPTSREHIPALLADIKHVMVPMAMRINNSGKLSNSSLPDLLDESGISLPVLIRPAGSHGGDRLQLVEAENDLTNIAADIFAATHDYYLSAYCDYRSGDGFYRKYRVIFVDRQPFPYHLAISTQWLVHYVSADMLSHAWKQAEEQRFLEYPAAVLGEHVMHALHTIGKRLNLDFCGIDFSILPDGRLLVFEANATMLVHLEQYHRELQYKNPHVQHILDAFDAMLTKRIIGNSPQP